MILSKLIDDLERLGKVNDLEQSDKSKKYLNITKETGEFLFVLTKAVGATKVLEIGTSNGYSTIWLASALPDSGMLYTIEVDAEKIREAAINIDKAGLSSKVTQIAGDVREVLDDVAGTFDLIFLDADRATYVSIAEQLFSRLKQGGVLVCDNATSHAEELEAFVDWIHHQSQLTMTMVPVGKGELLVYQE